VRSLDLDEGLAGAWVDYDDDGYADLFVANECGLSILYRNRPDGTFEDVTTASGALVPIGGMGVAVGYYDGDGRPDVFASAMYPDSRWARSSARSCRRPSLGSIAPSACFSLPPSRSEASGWST
jgi:VCBS repeat protein